MSADSEYIRINSVSLAVYDAAVRIGLFALLAYWSLTVIGPFLTVALWSAVLTVALYPLFDWLARRFGSRRLAAILVTLMCLLMVIGPVTWLGFGFADTAEGWVRQFDADEVVLPLPPDSIRSWPLVGEDLHRVWTDAATDAKAVLREVVPRLKPLGGRLLQMSGTLVFGLLEFVTAIVIAGFLYAPGPRLVSALGALLRRTFGQRSDEMVKLAGHTIRSVSRGVVGIALVQSFLAGIGFLAVGIPAAGFLTLTALGLGIVQIGPAILILPTIVWSWTVMSAAHALAFTIYMIAVGLIDNVLRPFVIARGLTTPMPVILIGVLGGLLAYGVSGLFLGPIVLSVGWALVRAWVEDEGGGATALVPQVPGGLDESLHSIAPTNPQEVRP
jgi:predicted PurR-regulated permease PerM